MISTEIEGDPVTSDDSIDGRVSFDCFVTVDSVDASSTVLKLSTDDDDDSVVSFSINVSVVVGVVLRRVNRHLFVLFSVCVISPDSEAKMEATAPEAKH